MEVAGGWAGVGEVEKCKGAGLLRPCRGLVHIFEKLRFVPIRCSTVCLPESFEIILFKLSLNLGLEGCWEVPLIFLNFGEEEQ